MNKVGSFICGFTLRLGLFIAITEILKNPKNIKRIKRFIIGSLIVFVVFSLIMIVTHFDKELYKKEMKEIRDDYNSNI